MPNTQRPTPNTRRRRSPHIEWLSLVEVSGPFLTLAVLDRAFRGGLDTHEPVVYRRLQEAFTEWEESRQRPGIHRAWILFLLQDALGYPAECLLEGQAIPTGIAYSDPTHHESVQPTILIMDPQEPGRPKLPVLVVPPGQKPDAPLTGSHWPASPLARMQHLLQGAGLQAGFVTNGAAWTLVHVRKGEPTGYVTWQTALLTEETITLQAFRSLLGVRRVYGSAAGETLFDLLDHSAADQEEVTRELGRQVRQAVEVFLNALERLDRESGRTLLTGAAPNQVYEGALTVMMRLVFLLCAEQNGLLPTGDLYDRNYAVSTLNDQLREAAQQHGEEVLEHRCDAWLRLLATFRLIHGGCTHEDLKLPAYGGSLFDPERFPFLEGATGGIGSEVLGIGTGAPGVGCQVLGGRGIGSEVLGGRGIGADAPGIGSEVLGGGTGAPGVGCQVSGVRTPAAQPPCSPEDPKPKTQNLIPDAQDPRPKTQDPRRNAQHPTPKTQHPPRIDNRVVLHLLDALEWLEMRVSGGSERRRLSFRALGVEEIGHVYEGLLDHTARRADAPTLGLIGRDTEEPELPLVVLEEKAAESREALVAFVAENVGRSAGAVRALLEAEPPPHRLGQLPAACAGDEALTARVRPFLNIVRDDSLEHLQIYPTGALFMTAGQDRRSTGTHYTPVTLTEEIVRYTLEPLVYAGPAEGKPREEWKLRSATELLELKVCDPAMGSGAFLVQACRYLAERLVEAWDREAGIGFSVLGLGETAPSTAAELDSTPGVSAPTPDTQHPTPTPGGSWLDGAQIIRVAPAGAPSVPQLAELVLPAAPEERLAVARRLVADHCLYGVDKNPMAVEMAKLSLWLVTLAKGKPFTFLDHRLKHGDSLVGCIWREPTKAPTPNAEYPTPNTQHPTPNTQHPIPSTQYPPAKLLPLPPDIPDSAFRTRRLREQNARERQGQLTTDSAVLSAVNTDGYRRLAEFPDDPEGQRRKAESYRRLREDSMAARRRLAADLWCAAWFWPLAEKERRREEAEEFTRTCAMYRLGVGCQVLGVGSEVLGVHGALAVELADPDSALSRRRAQLGIPASDPEPNLGAAMQPLDDEDEAILSRSWAKVKQSEEDQVTASWPTTGLYRAVLERGQEVPAEARARLVPLRKRIPFFHWALEFPDVYAHGGFDGVVGNPPFQGGQKITGVLGTDFRDYLVEGLASGKKGSADLCAYFFLRAARLLRDSGSLGLLATNTIAQGDTREVGLEQLTAGYGSIIRAEPSQPWPGVAKLEIALVWIRRGIWRGERFLKRALAENITAYLTEAGAVSGTPFRLRANEGLSFQGSVVLGLGFVLTPEQARLLIEREQRNRDVVFPYLGGEDLNSRPDLSPPRWVINFRDWPLGRGLEGPWSGAPADQQKAWLRTGIVPQDYPGSVAGDYPDCLEIVRERVKPERDRNNRKVRRDRWWLFGDRAPELYQRIAGLPRVVALCLVNNHLGFGFCPTNIVFSHKTVAFPLTEWWHFAILQSHLHYHWAWRFSSTMRSDINYSPTDCFDTFPFPNAAADLQGVGAKYYEFRAEVMLARQEGLTRTYNRFHNPQEAAEDIRRLRELHAEMDQAVAAAYGWTDLDLGHGFYETKQGVRFTLSEAARREVLGRLLKLNHERYAEEVGQGLHDKGGKKRGPSSRSGTSGAGDKSAAQRDEQLDGDEGLLRPVPGGAFLCPAFAWGGIGVMDILGYSERGLVNALPYEITLRVDPAEAQGLVGDLFDLANWPVAAPAPDLLATCRSILVEQSFSDFGDPDAVFLLGSEPRRAAVFWEAKRGEDYSLKKAWDAFTKAFRSRTPTKGLTSNLFCQLYFKQRLVGALKPGSGEDIETGLRFEAPFAIASRDRKIGEIPTVQRSVELLRQHSDETFYVMLIPEEWSTELATWWTTEVLAGSPMPMRWDPSHWGVITIPDIVRFCEAKRLNRTLAVLQHNEGQLYRNRSVAAVPGQATPRKYKGVSVIYAPSIEPATCLHFSWQGEGCALRNYAANTKSTEPKPDRSRTTGEVIALITQEFTYSTQFLSVKQVPQWRARIEEHNKDWGIDKGAPILDDAGGTT